MNLKSILLGLCCTSAGYLSYADCTAVITYSGSLTICRDDSVVLNAPSGSGLTYEWKRGTTVVGTGATYAAKDAGDYTVTVDDGSCTQTSAAVTVTVNALPGANINPAGPMVLCPGQSKQLTVPMGISLPGGPTFTYTWKNGTATVAIIVADNRYNVNAAGTYTVLVTNNETGCSRLSNLYEVTVNPLPTAVITPSWSTEICEDGEVTLDAGNVAGYDYQWKRSGTAAGVQSAITVSDPGDYKVIVTDDAGCKDSSAITTVNVHPKPAVDILTPDTAVCAGELVLLHAETADTNLNYVWYDAAGEISGAIDTAYETGTTGDYHVIISRRDVYECADTSLPVSVTVNDLPEPAIDHEPGRVWTSGEFVSYQWYHDDVLIQGAEDSAYATDDPGLYKVMVTDGNGCSNFSDTLRILPEDDDPSRIGGKGNVETVTIYPNPVKDLLHIQSAVPVVVDIIDMAGRVALQQQGGKSISLGSLQGGVYFIRILNEEGILLKYDKLIKQ